MFFDYFDEDEEDEDEVTESTEVTEKPVEAPEPKPEEGTTNERSTVAKGQWRRIERRIYSPFWRAMHNLIAHPMLAVYRPWGEWLHEWTADRMYRPTDGRSPIVSAND